MSFTNLGFPASFASEGNPGQTYTAALTALKTGYRHLDCAWFYQNEGEVGEAIRDFLKEHTDVKREDIFITTKLWNNYHAKEHALPMIKAQNESWGLGYIDLLLIHFPCALEYVDPAEKQYPGWWLADGEDTRAFPPAQPTNLTSFPLQAKP